MISKTTWAVLIPQHEKNLRELTERVIELRGSTRPKAKKLLNDLLWVIHSEQVSLHNMKRLALGLDADEKITPRGEWDERDQTDECDTDLRGGTGDSLQAGGVQCEEDRRHGDRGTPRGDGVAGHVGIQKPVGHPRPSNNPPKAILSRYEFWYYQMHGTRRLAHTGPYWEMVAIGKERAAGQRNVWWKRLSQ